ncbi:MAG: hypothetical protein ACI4NN_06430 [Pyramidobacter sp.]
MYHAFGSLGLKYEDLWQITLADFGDMIEGWRYKEYLEARKDARLAEWIRVMVWAKKAPDIDDLAGVWEDGRIFGKMELYRRIVQRIKDRKKQ